jgi:prolipoprotein diacylglyceryltransferase
VLAVPRYPTQWIEAFAYLGIFLLLYFLYWKGGKGRQPGFLFGTFLVTLFGFRFFVEFLKANQVAFEQDMQLNMGQWLSVPLVIVGLYFILTSKKKSDEQSA